MQDKPEHKSLLHVSVTAAAIKLSHVQVYTAYAIIAHAECCKVDALMLERAAAEQQHMQQEHAGNMALFDSDNPHGPAKALYCLAIESMCTCCVTCLQTSTVIKPVHELTHSR